MKKIVIACYGIILIVNSSIAQTVNFTSSNLPIVVINTGNQAIPDDPKITADMGIINNGSGNRNNITDPFNDYNGKVGIETRGHSSQMFPMVAYGFELRDNTGNSVNKSILGMPKESDWILYAPYTDKTLMRNVLAYSLSRQLGHWAARCQFVEVVLNGDYIGVYVMMEKIKRNANRVNIVKMDNTMISGDALTGGYIFSLDKDPNAWQSSFPNPANHQSFSHFSYVTPKPEDIVPEQQTYIRNYVDSFERSLSTGNYADTNNGYRRFIDVPSFMDYFYINEVSRNVDGYRLSSFFYKDRDSKNRKIIAGPVWDYDLAFRNADYCDGSLTAGWAYNFNYVCRDDNAGLVPFWWEAFMKDTAYTATLRCRWKDLRQTVLSESNIDQLIDSAYGVVAEASDRHFVRWPILGMYIWPNPDPIPTTYSGEIMTLKSWIRDRLKWIDLNIPNNGSCSDFIATGTETVIISTNPNPFPSQLTVSVTSKMEQDLNLEVYDMMGRRILSQHAHLQAGNNNLILPSDRWSKGQYLLKINSSNGDKEIRRVMKN